jgi:hypothetical protein
MWLYVKLIWAHAVRMYCARALNALTRTAHLSNEWTECFWEHEAAKHRVTDLQQEIKRGIKASRKQR